MPALELIVSVRIAGDPADVGNADNVAVLVRFENIGAEGRGRILSIEIAPYIIGFRINTD
jgi:hypothetical protein